MPRQPRYFVPGMPQHVIQRGVDRQPTFFESADYELYRDVLRHASCQYDCEIHSYVLMTNHTHLLVTPGTDQSIPNLMQAIGREYVQAINRQYSRTGTLWQGRYKASVVQNDHYLLSCYRYIELNPVRAGMVPRPSQYPYSSYRRHAIGQTDELVSTHDVYEELGKTEAQRCAAYRTLFVNELPTGLLKEIRDTTNACQILGNDKFKDQIGAMLGRSVRPGKAGRPKKQTA